MAESLYKQRVDFKILAQFVAPRSRVLDIGSGDGRLLELLKDTKQVEGRGIELSQEGVNQSVARGLSVVQGDADRDLVDYPEDAFDYVILSQTLQATHKPDHVLRQMLRIGHHALVSFPNFGHWHNRLQFLFLGRMPVTSHLPKSWYATENIHFCTIMDFIDLCRDLDAVIEAFVALDAHGREMPTFLKHWGANLLSQQAVFLLRRP